MSVDIYYVPASSPCRSVLLAAKHFGLKTNLKLVDLMNGETRTPEYIKMNPQHAVPTVEDDGLFLAESRAILQYFANKYAKDDTVYPKDPKERYVVDHRLQFDAGTLYQRFGDLYYPIMFAKQPYDEEKAKKLDEALELTEGFLGDNNYIAGNNITIADFAVIASLTTIESVGHDLSKFPKVQAYIERCKNEIDGFTELNQQGADAFGGWYKSVVSGQ